MRVTERSYPGPRARSLEIENCATGEDAEDATSDLLDSVQDSSVAIRRKQLQNFKRDRAAKYKDQDGRNAPWISQAEERSENNKGYNMFNAR